MLKDTLFPIKTTLKAKGKVLSLEEPVAMGILNLTPDSFFSGSRLWDGGTFKAQQLVDRAGQMLSEGAAILDLGAYSTRPGADDISPPEELDRLLPAVEVLRKHFPHAWLSVDTFRANIAKAAVDAGAHIINDVSGGNLDAEMFQTVAECQVPYILMHMRGTPATMTKLNQYNDLVADITIELLRKAYQLRALGVVDIVFDPGFGFAKSIDQNFELLSSMEYLTRWGYPVLAGISRKSMIYRSLNITPDQALNGTTCLHAFALSHGARILRVHDVKAATEAIQLYKLLNHA